MSSVELLVVDAGPTAALSLEALGFVTACLAAAAQTVSASLRAASGGRPCRRRGALGLRRRRGLRHGCLRRLNCRRRLLH